MEVSCIVDSIVGKMGLISKQNVTYHKGVRINLMAEFQLATNVHRFKMVNALDMETNSSVNNSRWTLTP